MAAISENGRMTGSSLCVVVAAGVLLFACAAYGGIVSGVVRNNGTQQEGKTLVFTDKTRGTTVQTNSDMKGRYNILLPPGFFVFQIDRRVCGQVQSSSQPVRHDVEMTSCR